MTGGRNRTLHIIFTVTLAVMILIAADVFIVTIEKVHLNSGTDLTVYAEDASTVTETITALRGNIYDATGSIIAQDVRTYDIVCILDSSRPASEGQIAYVKDKEETALILSGILDLDYDTIMNYFNQDVYQTELGNAGRHLSKSTRDEIAGYNLPGIEFTDSIERYYPYGTFASNLIGYAQNNDEGEMTGKMGLELYLDSYLRGTDGYTTYQADKNGYILPGMKEETVNEINGNNVYLTINQALQNTLEASMLQTVEEYEAIQVWGAIMEIDTGKILAWGQYPSFDANVLEISEYTDYVSQLQYEPGSTLKTFTWAAAIEEGVYDGTMTTYTDKFCYTSGTDNIPYRTSEENSFGCIYNARKRNYGIIDLDKGYVYSANTVAATIETEVITPAIYLSYLLDFGFFSPLSVDGIESASGVLNWEWPSDKLTLSFGQGSSVTMLQMLKAYSGILSDGTMVEPYVVASIRDAYDNSKVLYQAETTEAGQPISASTAKQVQKLMERVVSDADGTGSGYAIPECAILAKTGTAEVAEENEISDEITINSVIVGLPADDPKIVVYYCFQSPYPLLSSDKEPVTNILRKVAVTYGFVEESETSGDDPNESQPQTVITTSAMPSLINHGIDYALDKLSALDVETIVLGEGSTVIDQYPSSTSSVSTGQRVFLLTDTGSFRMVDLTGWTRKDVAALWVVTGFAFKLEGKGVVVSQSVPAGTLVSKGTDIEVVFSE